MSDTIKINLADHLPAYVERTLGENEKLCGKCGGIGLVTHPSMKAPQYIEACRHCNSGIIRVCPHCGKEYIFGPCSCKVVRKKIEADRLKKLFDKAEKITPEEAEKRGMGVFADPYSDHIFFEWYEIDEWYADDEKLPPFVWATTVKDICMNAADIIENACYELHEDAVGNIDDEDEKELQAFLDAWCEKQDCTTYWADESVAVIINRPRLIKDKEM